MSVIFRLYTRSNTPDAKDSWITINSQFLYQIYLLIASQATGLASSIACYLNMNEYENYAVLSYFINVGQGDSAVHILKSIYSNHVTAAVLIDGGTPQAHVAVSTAIAKIRNEINNIFGFRSIVVTHWDNDHYGGVMQMLYQDWENHRANNVAMSYVDWNETTLYCPWKAVNTLSYNFPNIKIELADGGRNYLLFFQSATVCWDPICRVVVGTYAIGYNLFTGCQHREEYGRLDTVQPPPDLEESLDGVYEYAPELNDRKRPIFLIYGVDGMTFRDEWAAPSRSWTNRNRNDKNASSIMALVIWPIPFEADDNWQMRVSLYTGGDAEEGLEEAMMGWLGAEGGRSIHLDVVKAGHHGSHFSTTEESFLHNLQYLVISAGRQYGHPSFAVAYCFLALADHREYRNMSRPSILCTRYPYWLRWHPTRLKLVDCNPATVMSWGQSALAIQARLIGLDGNFFPGYLANCYGDALRDAKAFALLNYLLNDTEANFDNIVNAHPHHPMVNTPSPPHPRNTEVEYRMRAVHQIQQIIRQRHGHAIQPGMNCTRGLQWVRTIAMGDRPNVAYDPEHIMDPAVLHHIREAAQIWDNDDDLAWAYMFPDQEAVASAANWAFERGTVDTYGLPATVNIQPGFMASNITPPGFNSVEDWIKSLLMRGLVDEGPNAESSFDKVLSKVDSPCARWFEHCFSCIVHLGLIGKRNEGRPSLTGANIRLKLSKDEAQGHLQDSSLSFSTDEAVRTLQFGTGAGPWQTPFGFQLNVQGVLFALDGSSSLTIAQLAGLINFPLSTNVLVSKLLGSLELSTYEQSRSGIWFIPQFNSRTIMRIAMRPNNINATGELKYLISDKLGPIKILGANVVGTCVVEDLGPSKCESSSKLGLQLDLEWEDSTEDDLPAFEGKASIEFSESGFQLIFKLVSSTGLLEKLTSRALQLLGGSSGQSLHESQSPSFREYLSQALGGECVSVHRIAVAFDKDRNLSSFEISVEVDASFGSTSSVPFLATIRLNQGSFELSAQTWPIPLWGNPSCPLALHPFYETTTLTSPLTPNPIYKIPLKSLLRLPNDAHIPPGLPNVVTDVQLALGYSHGRTSATFHTILESDPNVAELFGSEDRALAPALGLERVTLDLGIIFPLKGQGGSTDITIGLEACLTLSLPAGPSFSFPEPPQVPIVVQVSYRKNDRRHEWLASATIEQLRLAHLCNLFAQDGSNHAILDLMGGIYVARAGIEHQYDGGTSLKIDGSMHLGADESGPAAELDFVYQHQAKSQGWFFSAHLGLGSKSGTLRVVNLLKDIIDETELPGFLRNLALPLDKLKVRLECKKISDKTNNAHVIFSLTISVDSFAITLVQLRSVASANLSALARASDERVLGAAEDTGPAQLLRVVMPTIRRIPDFPVVGTIEQPFDQLGVVWTNRDLSDSEVGILNDNIFESEPLLSKDGAIGIPRGIHFQVTMQSAGKRKLIIDHVVKRNRKSLVQRGLKQGGNDTGMADETQSSEKTIAPISRKFGPLSMNSIGLSISGDSFSTLVFSLDATLTFGPISVKLIGLTLTADLKGIKTLDSLRALTFKALIGGMALEFEKPDTRLSGLLIPFGKDTDPETGFMGAMAVSVAKWSVTAAGMYTENKLSHLKSVFAFGALRGTLFTIGSVEFNSFTGGFGYNSTLRLPSVSQVAEFPFIAMNSNISEPTGSLTSHLETLSSRDKGGWVTTEPGSMWLAAGVGFKAFQTIDSQILVALTMADEPKFAVIGQATAVFPKGKSLDKAFLVLDIVIASEIDPTHGTILVAGELTPRSFILDPSCRLTGAFGFKVFLAGSPHQGDFVFTVGGYHSQYAVPSHYPVTSSRVGIRWQYDSQIYISGEAYFAITPQVAMGGGRMDLVVDKGWVRVVFSAWADFFMHYHPFNYALQVGISLWAEVNIPALLCSIHLGPKEFSARLDLQGPPMAGHVHLHFWKYDAIIAFGAQAIQSSPLSWEQFLRMVKNMPAEAHESDAIKSSNHTVNITKGVVPVHKDAKPATDDKSSSEVEIRATHLEFQVQARVPILSLTIGAAPRSKLQGSASLYARPMQDTAAIIDSHLTVILHPKGRKDVPVELGVQTILKQKVAPALWGQYKKGSNPASIASESMPEHALALDFRVEPAGPSEEDLPTIDIVGFSSTNLKEGKIPTVKEAKEETFRLESVQSEERGHAHMQCVVKMVQKVKNRPKWAEELLGR
ncbi:hypothetical protein NW761_013349 [Fusarium oxysporum]|nr:hypothetical protein NW758_012634 [Fusarium oxysporum]KAJ4074959.1 hypothetical protein NW761_013349 [Fusarium oxysporum]